MKKIVIGLALIASIGVLSACGEPAQAGDTINEKAYTYEGKPLHCVVSGIGNTQMMSCDWVRYHDGGQ